MIASVANAQKKTNEAATDVSLTFKHALTQVNIEVTKEAGYTYTISKVELTGIKGSGTFTYAGVNAGTWTAGTETSVSYAYELGAFSDDKTTVKAGNALMLIPQALTDAKISIEYTVEKDGSKIAENSTCNYGGRNRKSFWKRNQAACIGGTMWRDYYGLFYPRCAGSRI